MFSIKKSDTGWFSIQWYVQGEEVVVSANHSQLAGKKTWGRSPRLVGQGGVPGGTRLHAGRVFKISKTNRWEHAHGALPLVQSLPLSQQPLG